MEVLAGECQQGRIPVMIDEKLLGYGYMRIQVWDILALAAIDRF
jgi:hypothetical protein